MSSRIKSMEWKQNKQGAPCTRTIRTVGMRVHYGLECGHPLNMKANGPVTCDGCNKDSLLIRFSRSINQPIPPSLHVPVTSPAVAYSHISAVYDKDPLRNRGVPLTLRSYSWSRFHCSGNHSDYYRHARSIEIECHSAKPEGPVTNERVNRTCDMVL